MNVQQYVDKLFAGYESNADMEDFKEELCSNLQERIKYMEKKGMDSKEAFKKATDELGDITEIANQISNEKRKEYIENMYMKTKNYLDVPHIIGYLLAGGLLAIGIIFTLLAFLRTGDPVAGLGSLIPFFILPVCAFVFLGLTQETARNFPMPWKRALVYVAAVAVILFGVVIFALTFFVGELGLEEALGTLIPFVIPGSLLMAFLVLTEKNRKKPWVIEQEVNWAAQVGDQFSDPHTATKFGLFSGALWIFAIALFITFGFLFSFAYSWLVFVFAVAAQLLVQAFMMSKK